MDKFKDIIVNPHQTIFKAVEKITANKRQFVLVVDAEMKLLGMVTDGDIRRGILKGIPIDQNITKIMNPNPFTASQTDSRGWIVMQMKNNVFWQCPIVDENRRLLGIEYLEGDGIRLQYDNWVVIMAGGLGKRLHPITKEKPKALIEVQGRPILEHIIIALSEHDFRNIYLSVNYKLEMIEEYFGDGSDFGVAIKYIKENRRLGTAGSLSLLQTLPKDPILVMNCDLVTDINYSGLLHFHEEHESIATMCVKEYDFEVPYGVVNTDQSLIVELHEKPVEKFYISAGIYLLNPETIELIPPDSYYDMPQLFQSLINNNARPRAFPIHERWIDVGRLEDLKIVIGGDH